MSTGPAPEGAVSTRVRILGTGAMACWLGGRLARSGGCEITLAGTWPAALERIGREGLRVDAPGASFSAGVRAANVDGPLGTADVAIVLVKAPRTSAVATHAFRSLADDGFVVTLQNGLGQRETLERAVAARPVVVGVATVGARLVAPGHVQTTGPGRVVLGRDARCTPGLEALASRLQAAGMATEVVTDIAPHVWRKLAANCAINALSALGGLPNGALLERPELRASFEAAAREAGAVAAALGIALGDDPLALAVGVATATAANRSSMLQDIERGAPTEVDAINGAVVREGRRLGVPTPVNERLWRAVREREGAPVDADDPKPWGGEAPA